jgi:hypothetical protein
MEKLFGFRSQNQKFTPSGTLDKPVKLICLRIFQILTYFSTISKIHTAY